MHRNHWEGPCVAGVGVLSLKVRLHHGVLRSIVAWDSWYTSSILSHSHLMCLESPTVHVTPLHGLHADQPGRLLLQDLGAALPGHGCRWLGHPHLLQLLVFLGIHLLLHVLESKLGQIDLSWSFVDVVCSWRSLPNHYIGSITRGWFIFNDQVTQIDDVLSPEGGVTMEADGSVGSWDRIASCLQNVP